ncbi:hypothetical protein Naga_101654g2 [Nannochloropsis gaditana]|uniref:Uncharacterized protein n=1 Tax=Nannochloropsis gaditana TaxID=72520 RepID=W7TA80_9STRA|nr:hypothetical protein Naga_101654g2 [Nannochloropsis gaditana]
MFSLSVRRALRPYSVKMQPLRVLQLVVWLATTVVMAGAAGTTKNKTPERKTAQLAALHKRTASHGVIHMTDDLYPHGPQVPVSAVPGHRAGIRYMRRQLLPPLPGCILQL